MARREKIGQPVPEGNVVKDFYIGGTHIKICDDYCKDTTPEEVDEILRDIARMVQPHLAQVYAEREAKAKAEAEVQAQST